MQVSVLLQSKGSEVVTVPPDRAVGEVLRVLADRRIGAVVVSSDGAAVDGVLSERDVVLGLSTFGPDVLDRPASALMSADVVTCQPDTTIEHLMATMTDRRVRHVPVVVGGSLAGLVSIGDVVKQHIAVLESESQAIRDYIARPY